MHFFDRQFVTRHRKAVEMEPMGGHDATEAGWEPEEEIAREGIELEILGFGK